MLFALLHISLRTCITGSVQFVLRDTGVSHSLCSSPGLSCGRELYLSVKGPHWDNGLDNTRDALWDGDGDSFQQKSALMDSILNNFPYDEF